MKTKITSLITALLILFSSVSVYAEGSGTSSEINFGLARLTASGKTMYQANPGETVSVSFSINNVGNGNAININSTLAPSSDGSVYPLDETTNFTRHIIPINGSDTVNFKLGVSDSATPGTKILPMTIDYQSYDGKNGSMQKLTVNIIVNVAKRDRSNVLTTTDVKIAPSSDIMSGQAFIVTFEVANDGIDPARNISLSLGGLKDSEVYLSRGLSSESISKLSPGERQFVTFYLQAEQNAKTGSRELKYTLSYTTPEGQTVSNESSLFFTIKKGYNQNASLVIENLKAPSGTLGLGKTAVLTFDVRNQGNTEARDVKVKAAPSDQSGLISKTVSTVIFPSIYPGEIKSLKFEFMASPAAATNNYPVEISVSMNEDPSKPESAVVVNQFIGIFIKGIDKKGEEGKLSTPKLIIEKYSFEPSLVEAGQNFAMNLTFFNTNSEKAVKNIKIFLTSPASSSATGAQETQNSSVFTPVDSSNTFYIDKIPPKGKVEKHITMFTIPDAMAKTHILEANFEYEDMANNPYTAKELIGVPVVQQARLQVGELTLQEDGFVGEEVPFSVPFYNTGKVTLYNMMVKLEGDFNSPTGEYYVGNFKSGATERFDTSLFPTEAGEQKGKLVFTYEDQTGQIKKVEKEFKMRVDESIPSVPTDENGNPLPLDKDGNPIYPDMKKPDNKLKKPIFMIVIVLVIIGVIIFVIKKIRRKKEASELTIDDLDKDGDK